LSIAGAAATCNLSRSYFIKAFKNTTGRTPHRWLLEHRVDRAKELLLRSVPIVDIALECSFADQSHFTRMFANIMGVPPAVWRRHCKTEHSAIALPEAARNRAI
jgi:AraC family transcriptional regulator